jgi:hypothetical protein
MESAVSDASDNELETEEFLFFGELPQEVTTDEAFKLLKSHYEYNFNAIYVTNFNLAYLWFLVGTLA